MSVGKVGFKSTSTRKAFYKPEIGADLNAKDAKTTSAPEYG